MKSDDNVDEDDVDVDLITFSSVFRHKESEDSGKNDAKKTIIEEKVEKSAIENIRKRKTIILI